MKEHPYLMEQIIQYLHLLHINHIEIDRILAGSEQTEILSPEETQELQMACGIMDEMPGGMLICQGDGEQQILYGNRRLLHMFQCKTVKELQDITGNSFRGMVYPEDWNMVQEMLSPQSSAEDSGSNWAQYRVHRTDETFRWVEGYSRFLHSEHMGSFFYIFIEDVTDKREQEQRKLDDALNRANVAAVAKNAFLTNISHDIRTPLNAIFGFTALAKDNLQDPVALMDYLTQIETANKKLLDMISQVLEITALSSSDTLTEVACDLCAISREVYDFLCPHAQEKNIAYTMDCSSVRHSGIYADREKLKQIMLNLVNNALTYTKSGGTVSMAITEGEELFGQEAVYRICVEDTGIGISEDFINHVFEPFSREKNSTLSGTHSIGLGLTIVKSIVDKMGGTIEAKSAENQGSTFTATLRFQTQPLTDTSEEAEALQPVKQRILLVEDNDINREIETELLEKMNFTIEAVENGQVALQKMENASAGDYDLILMDLQMPILDGWQTSAAIRKLPDPAVASIPIIALSASIFLEDYQKSEASGINAHLAKPMNLPVLLDTIKKLTEEV